MFDKSIIFFLFTMEHVRKYHTQKRNNKSTFVEGLDVNQLIQNVIAHPLVNQIDGGTWENFQKLLDIVVQIKLSADG